jgi:autotransporter-associated beta strand protein
LAGLVTLSGSAHQLVLQGEGAITVSGQITGVGGLTSGFGAGIRIVSNNTNNYTGETAINAGTLAGIGANAFGSTSVIRIAALNTLSLRGDATTAFQRADTSAPYTLSTNNTGSTINVDAATGDTTAKTMSAGALNTAFTGASYEVRFTGANNTSLSLGAMTGAASTAAGTVIINNNITSTGTLTLASYTSANTADGETVIFTGNGNTFVTGAINPSATTTLSLNKGGAGTVTLSGTNTYTGATTVNDGKLVVNGSISTSVTTVASGATLGGSGTVRALTIDSGAFVTPGNSPGILTVNGAYTQAGQYTAEITGTTAGVGGYDQIGVTGTVDITGGSLVAMFSGAGYNEGDLFFILLNDSTDVITGTYTGFAQGATVATYGGLAWTISYNANGNNGGSPSFTGGNDIALMAIPEPNVPALLGGLGALALLRRRRA